MHFDVIKYWESIRSRTNNLPDWHLPDWHSLAPQHQQMMMQSINLMLAVMHDNNATGKENESK
jgi:hypothetical protein